MNRRRLLWLLPCLALALWAAEALTCKVCGKVIAGNYLRSDQGVFCSDACLERTLPHCAICDRVLTGPHLVAGGKRYCSDACFEKTLPACSLCGKRDRQYATMGDQVFCAAHAGSPRCGECRLPFLKGEVLSDNRRLCAKCRASAIMTDAQAREPFDLARREITAMTGYQVESVPTLHLVDQRDLLAHMGEAIVAGDDTVVRGYYDRKEEIREARDDRGRLVERTRTLDEKVFILYGQRRDYFMATAIHELTHDLLSDRFPRLEKAPTWVHEGVCQYLSAMYCRKSQMLGPLPLIESSPNPVYGDGYRYFKRLLGYHNWSGLKAWLERVDVGSLPPSAPTE
jgi:hypothetical protein